MKRVLIMSVLLAGQVPAQAASQTTNAAVYAQALTRDMQIMRQGAEDMHLVFWMPFETGTPA